LFTVSQPVIFVGACLTVLFGTLILFEPKSVFFVIILITFFFHPDLVGKEYIVNILGFNWYSMDWILLFSFLSWSIRVAMGTAPKIQKSILSYLVAIFLAWLIVFSFISFNKGNTPQDIFADVRLFFYYISFFLVMVFAQKLWDIESIFWLTIILGTIGAIPEIIISLSGSGFDTLSGHILFFRRITGPHEVNYPIMLVSSMVIYPSVHTMEKKAILICSISISTIALFLSYTRGSWLAAIAGLLFSLILFSRQIKISRIMVILMLIGVMFIILNALGIFTYEDIYKRSSLVSSNRIDVSSFQRILEWRLALDIFLTDPIFGGGLGYIYRFYVPGRGPLEQIYIHNSFFYALSKMGAVGFSIFMSIFGGAFIVGFRTMKKLNNDTEKGLLIAFLSMIIVLLVKSTTSWHLNTLTTSLYLGLILGVVGAMNARVHNSTYDRNPVEWYQQ
jgi:O-antigen ligase